MINKPIVILVMRLCNSLTEDTDIFREALISHLKNNLGCEVLAYDFVEDFVSDLARLKGVIESKRVVAAIIKEYEYDEDAHQIALRQVRELDKRLPIFFYPHKTKDEVKGLEGFKRVYIRYQYSTRALDLLKKQIKRFVVPLDFFGTQNQQEVERVSNCLAHAYQEQYLDGKELGTPDYNHQVVAEALRVRLTKELIQEEFDSTLGREPEIALPPSALVYQAEVVTVKKMCVESQQEFFWLLKIARGNISPGSQGDDAQGFAIDPLTLKYCRTSGWGCHQLAPLRLEYLLQYAEDLNGVPWKKRKSARERIISGVFFPKVDGFASPIVQLAFPTEEEEKRLVDFFEKTRIAIPVVLDDWGLRLLGCSFSGEENPNR